MPPRTRKKTAKIGYMISAVAEMYDIHPQTLRMYEREKLLVPSRSEGNTRLYTEDIGAPRIIDGFFVSISETTPSVCAVRAIGSSPHASPMRTVAELRDCSNASATVTVW